MKTTFFLTVMLLFFAKSTFAQDQKGCGNFQRPQASFFDYQEQLNREIQQRTAANASARAENSIYYIPIIFHILHKGEAVGQGLNLNAAQIYSQIDVLNEDFRMLNADRTKTLDNFKSRAADSGIEFVAAQLDPNGNKLAEKGIRRILWNDWKIWNVDNFDTDVKMKTIWDPNRYLNIWVFDTLRLPQGTSGIGYGQYPDLSGLAGVDARNRGEEKTDGVAVKFRNLGSVNKYPQARLTARFSLGRTLTHEIAHWLGVLHTFNETGFADCEKDPDYCADTPIANQPSYDCPITRLACSQTVMVQNFMDYSDDVCMTLFTAQQVQRMRTVLQVSPRRKELLLSNVLAIPDLVLNQKIVVFPNPSTNETVEIVSEQALIKSYTLYNALGQVCAEDSPNEKQCIVPTSDLKSGFYTILLKTDYGNTTKKIIVSGK